MSDGLDTKDQLSCGCPDGTTCPQCEPIATPETEQPEVKETGEEPKIPMILCKITASLDEDGKVVTNVEGGFQNMVIVRGLIALLDQEIGNLQSMQPGATRTPETKLLGHVVQTMNNVSNVLVNINGVLISMQQQMNSLPEAIFSGAGFPKDEGSE